MSRRAIKAINWSAIAERVPEEQKGLFVAFKAKSDQYLRRMMANPETSPKLNWEYYRKNVTTPGLVEKFQKEYEALQVPFPADKYTSLIDGEEKKILQEIEEFRQKCEQDIEKFSETVAKLKAIMPYNDMTIEEFLEYHPECAAGTVYNPSIWPHTPLMKECENLSPEDDDDDDH
ncbi:PREDICTED: ATP synthase subunit d, mitochondrial-like [Polistes dominula]|uniref:ATP synthase subunit d, mitochondrial n=1 Tax=Polistes dominula TaxID=743375 RepID=A0ABM1I715_POLDO|nr:PREDICTED: ATP synthase subunit d, mitochondrial-like [Polistes dominula]